MSLLGVPWDPVHAWAGSTHCPGVSRRLSLSCLLQPQTDTGGSNFLIDLPWAKHRVTAARERPCPAVPVCSARDAERVDVRLI